MAFRPTARIVTRETIEMKHIGPDGAVVDRSCTVLMAMRRASEAAQFFEALRTPPVRADGQSDEAWALTQKAAFQRLARSDASFLKTVIVGWDEGSGIEDDDGRPLPYSPEAVDLLLDHDWFVTAAVQTYNRASSGARRGN